MSWLCNLTNTCNIISLGKIGVLCLAGRECGVTKNILPVLFPCTPPTSSDRRTVMVFRYFLFFQGARESSLSQAQTSRVCMYRQSWLSEVQLSYKPCLDKYEPPYFTFYGRLVSFCTSAEEWRGLSSGFWVVSHTARRAVLSASPGLRAPLCLLLQGSALLHFPVRFYTSEGKN